MTSRMLVRTSSLLSVAVAGMLLSGCLVVIKPNVGGAAIVDGDMLCAPEECSFEVPAGGSFSRTLKASPEFFAEFHHWQDTWGDVFNMCASPVSETCFVKIDNVQPEVAGVRVEITPIFVPISGYNVNYVEYVDQNSKSLKFYQLWDGSWSLEEIGGAQRDVFDVTSRDFNSIAMRGRTTDDRITINLEFDDISYDDRTVPDLPLLHFFPLDAQSQRANRDTLSRIPLSHTNGLVFGELLRDPAEPDTWMLSWKVRKQVNTIPLRFKEGTGNYMKLEGRFDESTLEVWLDTGTALLKQADGTLSELTSRELLPRLSGWTVREVRLRHLDGKSAGTLRYSVNSDLDEWELVKGTNQLTELEELERTASTVILHDKTSTLPPLRIDITTGEVYNDAAFPGEPDELLFTIEDAR